MKKMVGAELQTNYRVFMDSDLGRFLSEWVIISDGEVVSHGQDVKKLIKDFKSAFPSKQFLLSRVPGKEAMIL